MVRKPLAMPVLSLLIAVAAACYGCAMCQDCYDYTPPVIGSGQDMSYPSVGRAGSALSGVPETAIVPEDGAVVHE
jgi:hypothetical protein